MKTVGLVSGGKDSCYNMMQCVAGGHDIVALANLEPLERDELDSYMYQTVGHHGVSFYAEAMGLPLFRATTSGIAKNKGKHYQPTSDDEVEDLYKLLLQVQSAVHIEAVAVGAILSDYQRVRVENVCSRLGLISLSYLWRRNQTELLQEMIDSHVEAIIVKVAALGLDPVLHLGMTIRDIQAHMLLMKDKYGLNVCGEGGEYETFTLNCPLFKKKIIIDEKQLIIHSNDPVAPVGYLNLRKLHLEPKTSIETSSIKNSYDYVSDLNECVYSDLSDVELSETELETMERLEETTRLSAEEDILNPLLVTTTLDELNGTDPSSPTGDIHSPLNEITLSEARAIGFNRSRRRTESADRSSFCSNPPSPLKYEIEKSKIEDTSCIFGNNSGWYQIGGIIGEGASGDVAMEDAISKLIKLVSSCDIQLKDICSVNLYIRDMSEYSSLNQVYVKALNFPNPPTRVCVECPLPEDIGVIMDAVAYLPHTIPEDMVSEINPPERITMHVQSISHWAPANIGPYSQAVKIGNITNCSGQIALVPGAMHLVDQEPAKENGSSHSGGARQQCALSLRHVGRIIRAMDSRMHIRDVVQGVCYLSAEAGIGAVREARRQWERRTTGAIVDYVTVTALPRNAAVEWHVWAHSRNHRFDYEETGCSVGDYKVAIRKRWNYENTVAAVMCYVATGSSPSTTQLYFPNEESMLYHRASACNVTRTELVGIFEYCIKKLLSDYNCEDNSPVVGLRVFYRVSVAPNVNLLIDTLKEVRVLYCQRLVFTVIPVVHLHNAFTFLSIYAVRNEID